MDLGRELSEDSGLDTVKTCVELIKHFEDFARIDFGSFEILYLDWVRHLDVIAGIGSENRSNYNRSADGMISKVEYF